MLCYRTAGCLSRGVAIGPLPAQQQLADTQQQRQRRQQQRASETQATDSAQHAGQPDGAQGEAAAVSGASGHSGSDWRQPPPQLRARRARQLYGQALQLLDERLHPLPRARAYEHLADSFFTMGEGLPDGFHDDTDDETDDGDHPDGSAPSRGGGHGDGDGDGQQPQQQRLAATSSLHVYMSCFSPQPQPSPGGRVGAAGPQPPPPPPGTQPPSPSPQRQQRESESVREREHERLRALQQAQEQLAHAMETIKQARAAAAATAAAAAPPLPREQEGGSASKLARTHERLKRKALLCAAALATAQLRHGEHQAALDSLQHAFSCPGGLAADQVAAFLPGDDASTTTSPGAERRGRGQHGGPPGFGSSVPGGGSSSVPQAESIVAVCMLLCTLADTYVALWSTLPPPPAAHPPPPHESAEPPVALGAMLHVAAMEPYSVVSTTFAPAPAAAAPPPSPPSPHAHQPEPMQRLDDSALAPCCRLQIRRKTRQMSTFGGRAVGGLECAGAGVAGAIVLRSQHA
eukprot:COSAG01_NODE_199_length_22202_cov_23.993668_16_plen_518_part_00